MDVGRLDAFFASQRRDNFEHQFIFKFTSMAIWSDTAKTSAICLVVIFVHSASKRGFTLRAWTITVVAPLDTLTIFAGGLRLRFVLVIMTLQSRALEIISYDIRKAKAMIGGVKVQKRNLRGVHLCGTGSGNYTNS